jgi:UDP-N-acetylmuramoyl-tripeptide--D-alanyl-D-alanine ligase
MRLNLTLAQLAGILGGDLTAKNPLKIINAVSKDTRTIKRGEVYWALKGANYDGHNFAAEAAAKGAALIIAEKGRLDIASYGNAGLIEVGDTLLALQTLAKYHRRKHNIKTAAITGSNGKSTTKQMLLAMASAAGKTSANTGNLNNQVGVPLSLLEIDSNDIYGVFELGASKKGDIDEISSLVLPDAAVITNISPAHLEFFGDMETVYQTKTEIIKSLNKSGTLVYNIDDIMLRRIKTEYGGKYLSFGFSPDADVMITDEQNNFSFKYKGKEFNFDITLERHNKLNAAAAAAAAIALGLSKEEISKGLAAYVPMPLRLQEERRGNVKFILDYYNANPASMENALNILMKNPAPHIAVLGDMLELGGSSRFYHEELARKIIALGVKRVFLSGANMKAAYDILCKASGVMAQYSVDKKDLIIPIKQACAAGGTILIKASRAMGFEDIYKAI